MATQEMKTLKFPSASTIYEIVDKVGRQETATKQDKLVDMVNIKTINGKSVLGTGDLEIMSSSSLTPSGVDTAANILEYAYDKGIYISSDTGYWFYWDETNQNYRGGGVYIVNPENIQSQIDTLTTNLDSLTEIVNENDTVATWIVDYDQNSIADFLTITAPTLVENRMYLAELILPDIKGQITFRGKRSYQFTFTYFLSDDTIRYMEFRKDSNTGKFVIQTNDSTDWPEVFLAIYAI